MPTAIQVMMEYTCRMSRARSERAATVLIGASHAQPPSARVSASPNVAFVRTSTAALASSRVPRARSLGIEPSSPRSGGVGESQEGMQQRVRAALDGLPVAHLVDAVTAAAQRRDEDHAGVGYARQALSVVS